MTAAPESPCTNRPMMNTTMSVAVPAMRRPITKSTAEVTSDGNGPERSVQLPASTMPMMPAASGTANASANRASPSRSRATSGITVVTAIASNAARKMSENMPIESHRYGLESGPFADGACIE